MRIVIASAATCVLVALPLPFQGGEARAEAPPPVREAALPADFSSQSRRTRSQTKPDPATASPEATCDAKDMLVVNWEFIERVVIPVGDQRERLDALKAAVVDADGQIQASCAIESKLTPTARLDAMTKRLEMRLAALNILRQPLEAFYSSLDDEQKARFVASTGQVGAARAESEAAATKPQPRRRKRPIRWGWPW
jgi:hypothetical protein